MGLANYNFNLQYKSGKYNVDTDALSRILWSSNGEDCNHLDGQTVKAIMMDSTIEAPLFESYQGRDIVAKSLHTSTNKDLLFPLKGNTHTIEPQKSLEINGFKNKIRMPALVR